MGVIATLAVTLAAIAAAPSNAGEQAAARTFLVPGTAYVLRFGSTGLSPTDRHAANTLLTALVSWVARNSDLPESHQLPTITFASTSQLGALRQRNRPGAALPARGVQAASDPLTSLALYEFATQTIHLREDWTGASPAEYSVLVHELVHHLQSLAEIKYECPAEREKLAYRMQSRWLALFGTDLQKEFEIDPFTLLVTTSCGH
jgi:hypothetical protein